MKPIPAIVEPAQDHAAEQVIAWREEERNAETNGARFEQRAATERATAASRRLQIGELLVKQRAKWPQSGPRAAGWGLWLAKAKIDDSTAWRYMDAWKVRNAQGDGVGDPSQARDVRGNDSERADREVEPASRPPSLTLVPDPEPDAKPDAKPEVEIDRDTWCTPRWLTEAIGRFDLDPCSNDRSHVQAIACCRLDRGSNGLTLASDIDPEQRVFINPPYSDVSPWIAAYKHTRFCFLLKLDTSTRWFAELYTATALILIPRKRLNFEPPPGVPPDKAVAQQFPHALFYAHAEDATDAIRALCWSWRVDH